MKIGNVEIIFHKKDSQEKSAVISTPKTLDEVAARFGLKRTAHRQYNLNSVQGQALAYAYCSIVRSIINIKSSACAEFKAYAFTPDEKIVNKPKEYELISRPNPYQDIHEFVAMAECFMQIFGRCYIFKLAAVGMPLFDLYIIPNTMISAIEETQSTLTVEPLPRIKEYRVNIGNGKTLTLTPDEVFIVNDISPNPLTWDCGISRLVSLEPVINSFVASFEAVNELMVNRGMLGIITMEPTTENAIMLPETQSDRKNVEEGLKRYGTLENQLKYLITWFKTAFVPVSSTITDLGLTETQNQCMREIATAYQVPTALLESAVAKYNNQATAQRDLYIKAIIPDTKRIFAVLNKIYGFKGFGFVPAFDHLSIFREDMNRYASAYKTMVEALSLAQAAGYKTPEECANELSSFTITTI